MFATRAHLSASRQSAFTLIELLVVITIVALLISILLPALTAARNNAQKGACLSNLRQSGIGFGVYATDNDEWLPVASGFRAGAAYKSNPSWARVIAKTLGVSYITEQPASGIYIPYAPEQQPPGALAAIKANGIFQCPSDRGKNVWGGDHATSYAGNENVLGWSDSYFSPGENPQLARRQTLTLLHPSERFFIGESVKIYTAVWADYNTALFPRQNIADDVSSVWAGDIHLGAGNYLWGDGHASTKRVGEIKGIHFDRD